MASFTNEFGNLEFLPNEFKSTKRGKSAITFADLSQDQRQVYDAALRWMRDAKSTQLLTLGGYAGTGKSTIVPLLAKSTDLRIAFCAFTGKAANSLHQKLMAADLDMQRYFCGTLHSLIYVPILDVKQKLTWELKEELDFDLIIVDEASMVDNELFQDLKSFGMKILAVGDHGQLPPIGGNANLMQAPMLRLEKIHRQAESNPIITLSAQIRATGSVRGIVPDGNSILMMTNQAHFLKGISSTFDSKIDRLSTSVLSYRNVTRNLINKRARTNLQSTTPCVDDIVICLKNTRFGPIKLYNGMRGVLKNIFPTDARKYEVEISFPDDNALFRGLISVDQFGKEKTYSEFSEFKPPIGRWSDVGLLFDFGYCLTVHKAQGSQFEDTFVYLERPHRITDEEWARWLYTAVTRASERLILLNSNTGNLKSKIV